MAAPLYKSVPRRVLIHAVLIVGSILFSAPFFWLASTSAKAPDELYPPRWFPILPDRVVQSPYMRLRTHERPIRPMRVDDADWDRVMPEVKAALTRGLGAVADRLPDYFEPYLAHPELAEAVFARLLRRAPVDLFERDTAEAVAWFLERADAEEVREAFNLTYCRVAFSELVFVSWDMRIETPLPPTEIPWRVIDGDAELVPRVEEARRPAQEIHYDFRDADRFVVQAVVPLDWPFDTFKKMRLANHADRSWHTFYVTLELDGRRLEARSPAYVATDRWQDHTWQIRSYEDDTVAVRTWIPLHEAGEAVFNEPGKARVTIEYRQAPGLRAAFNKFISNYLEVGRRVPLGRYVWNSVFLVVMNILGQIVGSSLVAYAFARLRWPGREFCFVLLLATLMVPPQVTLIPVFLIFKEIGWFNTLRPLYVPAFAGSAFFIFLLRQFMRSIPTDLEDSAKIDGCGYLGIYWRIILPLIKPALATIAIFTFMAVWNDFMGPLIFVTNQELYPLSLGLFALYAVMMGQHQLLMAAAVLMTIPVIILFFAAQRQFIQGITLTGLKG